MIIILITFLLVVCAFQLLYIFNVLVFCKFENGFNGKLDLSDKKLSIIIPLFNSEKTIGFCLNSILKNNLSLVKKVIVVLDHCSDNSNKEASELIDDFKKSGIRLQILNSAYGSTGKVEAIKQGINHIKTKDVLLLDADIILEPKAIEQLFSFHLTANNLYSSCLVYPYQKQPYQKQNKNSLVKGIIYQDRLYRQNILKLVKNKHNSANFPGSIGIVKIEEYRKFLQQGFLEDLTASFNIIRQGNKISVLPIVLAYEIERENVKGVFFQRVRWSIGNIENTPLYLRTIFNTKGLMKRLIVISYPIMWYWQYYAITTGIIMAVFSGQWEMLLAPLFLYFFQIVMSSWLGRKKYNFTFPEILTHCIIFPFIITAALFGAVWMIIVNKKLYFKKNILFNRI